MAKRQKTLDTYWKPQGLVEAEDALMKWLLFLDITFDLVESEHFLRLTSHLNPDVKLMNKEEFKAKMCSIFAKKRPDILKQVRENDSKLSMTLDFWLSEDYNIWWSCTAHGHYIDRDWNLIDITLDSQCACTIDGTFADFVTDFHLQSKILALNLSEIYEYADDFYQENDLPEIIATRLPCLGKFLDLCTKPILETFVGDLIVMEDILKKINWDEEPYKAIYDSFPEDFPCIISYQWKYFWHNAATVLGHFVPLKKLLNNFCTAYNSSELTGRRDRKALVISEESWSRIELLNEFMEVFRNIITLIKTHDFSSLSFSLPIVDRVSDHFENWINGRIQPDDPMRPALISAIETAKEYFVINNDCYYIATVLNPLFNLRYFQTRKNPQKSIQQIEELLLKTVQECANNASMTNENLQKPSDAFGSLFPNLAPTLDCTEELRLYCQEQVFDLKNLADALQWWKSNAKKHPTLSRIARDYLAIPALSSSYHDVIMAKIECENVRRRRMDDVEWIRVAECLKSWLKE